MLLIAHVHASWWNKQTFSIFFNLFCVCLLYYFPFLLFFPFTQKCHKNFGRSLIETLTVWHASQVTHTMNFRPNTYWASVLFTTWFCKGNCFILYFSYCFRNDNMGSAYEAISKVKKKIPFCKIIYFNQNIKKKTQMKMNYPHGIEYANL